MQKAADPPPAEPDSDRHSESHFTQTKSKPTQKTI